MVQYCCAYNCRRRIFFSQASDVFCHAKECKTKRQRMFVCLSCIRFRCWKDHIHTHAEKSGHPVALDMECGQVYCFKCGGYKYDFDVNAAHEKSMLEAVNSKYANIIDEEEYEPPPEVAELMKLHEVMYHPDMGVRGIVNIAKETCFITVSLHCLMQTSSFTDYLFSYEHKCLDKYKDYPKGSAICFVCEFEDMAKEYFTDKKNPLVCDQFFFLMYKRLKKYVDGQNTEDKIGHDSHECFVDILQNLHEDVGGDSSDHCECVIHDMFGISYLNKLKCDNCEYCRSNERSRLFTIYFFFESYLDEYALRYEACSKPNEKNIDFSFNVYLTDLVRRHFRSLVGVETTNDCPQCKTSKLFSDKIPMLLPPVLNFNIQKPKGDYKFNVKYGEFLDMRNYVKNSDPKQPQNLYYLYAIIQHVEPDHYECYVRIKTETWFKCTNETAVEVKDIDSIYKLDPSVLFYHRMYEEILDEDSLEAIFD